MLQLQAELSGRVPVAGELRPEQLHFRLRFPAAAYSCTISLLQHVLVLDELELKHWMHHRLILGDDLDRAVLLRKAGEFLRASGHKDGAELKDSTLDDRFVRSMKDVVDDRLEDDGRRVYKTLYADGQHAFLNPEQVPCGKLESYLARRAAAEEESTDSVIACVRI